MLRQQRHAQLRIRKAEEALGGRIEDRRGDPELVLRACQYLGQAVLRPVDSGLGRARAKHSQVRVPGPDSCPLEPRACTIALSGPSVAVAPIAELLDESWVGWGPIELGSSLGRGGALIEQ
jgi:hypothetical protein